MLIPLLGTTLGAACVFFMRKNMKDGIQRSLTGFASGVMVAASVWSLLIPSIEQSESMGRFAFVPALVGLWAGMLFLLLLVSGEYNSNVFACTLTSIRKVLADIEIEEQNHAEMLYKYKMANGMQ